MPSPLNHSGIKQTDHAAVGEPHLSLAVGLKLPSISPHGPLAVIIGKFRGTDQIRTSMHQLLHAA